MNGKRKCRVHHLPTTQKRHLFHRKIWEYLKEQFSVIKNIRNKLENKSVQYCFFFYRFKFIHACKRWQHFSLLLHRWLVNNNKISTALLERSLNVNFNCSVFMETINEFIIYLCSVFSWSFCKNNKEPIDKWFLKIWIYLWNISVIIFFFILRKISWNMVTMANKQNNEFR